MTETLPHGSVQQAAKEAGEERVRFGIRLKFSLIIISFVTIVIVSITFYFAWREGSLLTAQVMRFVEREMVHLANTAQQSIGVDELSMVAAIADLKKIEYLAYAFILDRNGAIIQYFDRRGDREHGSILNDGVDRAPPVGRNTEEVIIKELLDPRDPGGKIFDFSKSVNDKLTGRKLGTVIIGLSDIIIRREIAGLMKLIVPLALFFLAVAVAGSIMLASFIIRPIRALTHGAEIVGRGDLDYRIDIRSRDELGMLARQFNRMTAQIREAKNKEIESRVMEEQIEMAREIQEGLNPTAFYDKSGIQIKGYTKAMRGVGGDYFDYYEIDEDRIGALISDVSGKGIPASLVMVMIRTVFVTQIKQPNVTCRDIVNAINTSLSADFAIDKFATLFFVIYHRKSGILEFSNAGHGPLFCYRRARNMCTVTKLDGMPIGIDEESEYKQAKAALDPGDIVVLYTDGVTETRNENNEEYGIKRLNRLIVENNHLNAEELVMRLVRDLEEFRGNEPPHDDTTILIMKRTS